MLFFPIIINSCIPNDPHQGGGSPYSSFIFLIIIVVVIIAIVSNKKSEEPIPITSNQKNKVVNVNFTGGLIGLFSVSPLNSLNSRITKENANGWKVIQVIPADSGNIFLAIFRFLLLLITFFLYTTTNGYYVIMERIQLDKETDNTNQNGY